MGSIIQSVGTRRWPSQAPSNSRQKQCKRCRAPPLFLDGSTTVEISLEEAGEDDPKFMQAMDFEDGRTMHVRDNGMGEEEVVIVSTDIDEPTATPFAMVMGQELNARDLDPDVDAGGDGNDTNDFTALTVAAGTGDVNLPKIMPLFLYSSAR